MDFYDPNDEEENSQSLLNDESVEDYTEDVGLSEHPHVVFPSLEMTGGDRNDNRATRGPPIVPPLPPHHSTRGPPIVPPHYAINPEATEVDDEDEEMEQFVVHQGVRIPAPTEFADIEIVGLNKSSSGRSCSVHGCCGDNIQIGDCLRLVKTIVMIKGESQEAIKLVKIQDGVESCTVAFLPRVWITLPKVQRNIGYFAVVKELYKTSPNGYKREKSHKNCGMASCFFLNDIARSE